MNDRRYGYFTCPKCGKRWESSHVYCDDSSSYFLIRYTHSTQCVAHQTCGQGHAVPHITSVNVCLPCTMSNRRYGYFECDCGSTWESSHVYCYGFTPKYEQDCRSCDTPCMPYRVEKLICSKCKQHDCICSKKDRLERTIDPNKPHRSDLCHKCKSGNPCM